MVSALDAVLQLKAQKDAKMVYDREQVNNAINMFQQARQQAIQNNLEQTKINALLEQNKLENNRKAKEDASQEILRDAQAKQLLASVDYLKNAGNSSAFNPDALAQAGIPQEDIQLTPKTFSYKGMQSTKLVPELKAKVGQTQLDDINQIDSTISDLKKNVATLKESKIQSGPGYATSNLPGADIYSQFTKSPEFNTWKADTGRAFQKYRKWATGVAAGYPELRMLSPNFPKSTDIPEVYSSKAESAINDMQRNRDLFLEHLSKAGYRTGELRNKEDNSSIKGSNNKSKIITLPSGKTITIGQ